MIWIVLLSVLLLGLLVIRYGEDSRDGRDWSSGDDGRLARR